jgi:predicted dehydrogenase
MPDTTTPENPDVTRRDALKLAGAAGLVSAGLPFQATAVQRVRAANDTVKFGMIGTGSRGSYLLKHLKDIDTGLCVALCDINADHLDKAAATIGGNPTKYKDYHELLNRSDIDAVLIATPLFVHFPVTRDSLLAGKHTFCEKSLVFRPEQLHALRDLSTSRPKQILQVGLQRRYSIFYQAVKDMIDKGMLGEVTHIHSQWHRNPGWTMKAGGRENLINWRLFKDMSGGLAAELASHQVDVADWMFGSHPESVVGVGGHEFIFDGRDISDNIQLIFRYPKGRKLVGSYISTNSHLPLFGATRTEFGELIMGTDGAVQITVGDDTHPALAVWYREPPKPQVTAAPGNEKKWSAGATMVAAGSQKGVPILLDRDRVTGNESFLDRELKYGRQLLYSKGILVPEEGRNPVDLELEGFFNSVKTGTRPKADLEVGLADSTAVMLSNISVEEDRKVLFTEMDTMGRAAPTT